MGCAASFAKKFKSFSFAKIAEISASPNLCRTFYYYSPFTSEMKCLSA